MVVYTDEKDLQWRKLLDKGLEIALVAHADPGETHGESVGLSRAFDLAERFGAVPISHRLSYELPLRYSELFGSMMENAGSNHTWLTSTLVVYTGTETKKNLVAKSRMYESLLEFGYEDENSSRIDGLITINSDDPQKFDRCYELGNKHPDIWENKTKVVPNALKPFLFVQVPREYEGRFMVVELPNYRLQKKGNMRLVQINWSNVWEVSPQELTFNSSEPYPNRLNNSSLLPDLLKNGFTDSDFSFNNPLLASFAPCEGYSRSNNSEKKYQWWHPTTRGEAVIIQRPIK